MLKPYPDQIRISKGKAQCPICGQWQKIEVLPNDIFVFHYCQRDYATGIAWGGEWMIYEPETG